MNETAAAKFYERVFTAYPDFQAWLANTNSPQDTMQVWGKMLAAVPDDVAETVVSGLERGELKMPEAYDRGKFGYLMRSWCHRIIDDRNRIRRNDTLQDEARKPNAAISQDPGISAATRALNEADDKWHIGEIGFDERCQRKAAGMRLVNPNTTRDVGYWIEKHRGEKPRGFVRPTRA